MITEKKKEIEIIGFTSAQQYSTCGTHNHENLKNRNLIGGICVQSPYHIIFELNYEHEISKIEIAVGIETLTFGILLMKQLRKYLLQLMVLILLK